MPEPEFDHRAVARKEYATDETLSVRMRTHRRYTYPQINFQAWVLDRIRWRGDEDVLDVGCGTGGYFEVIMERAPRGNLIASDLSLGMLMSAADKIGESNIELVNGDVESLPFADGSFDVVLANHMLYHVPDIDRAIREIKRVLRPDGVLIAATNSRYNMPEFDLLYRRAFSMLELPQEVKPPHRSSERFCLENGFQMLGRHFYAVARYEVPSVLIFPSVEPVMAYLQSTRATREPQLPPDVKWDDVMKMIEDQLSQLIALRGEFIVSKLGGALVAADEAGFAWHCRGCTPLDK